MVLGPWGGNITWWSYNFGPDLDVFYLTIVFERDHSRSFFFPVIHFATLMLAHTTVIRQSLLWFSKYLCAYPSLLKAKYII